MTIFYLVLKIVIALVALRYIGWPLLKLLWRLVKFAWPFFKASWGGVMRALAARPLVFVLVMALYAGMGVAMAGLGPLPKLLFRPEAAKTTWALGATYSAMRLGVVLVSSLLLAPLLVSVHRVRLKDRLQAGWGGATANYFAWLFALQAVILLGYCLALAASEVAMVRGMIDIIVQAATVILGVRLALVLPDIAIGAPAASAEARIDASWPLMEGRFWSTVWLFLLTLLPMLLLLIVFSRIGLPKPPNPPPISPPEPGPLPVTKALLIGRGLLGAAEAFTWALLASGMSELYARLKPRA